MSDHDVDAELAALRRENAILRETLDAIDGTVVVYDGERRFVLANRAYHSFFPHLPPASELVGKRYEEVLALSIDAGTVLDAAAYKNRTAFLEARAREILAHDATSRETHDLVRDRWYMIRVRRTPTGNRVALRVEITEQKRLQEALRKAREDAEQADRAKSRFLATVSHELRTPLNAVINFARLMRDRIHGKLGDPAYDEYARTIHQNGLQLLGLIDEVLDYARLDVGQFGLDTQKLEPGLLVQSVCRGAQARAGRAGVTLRVTPPAPLPAIHGDQKRLWHALEAVISRALGAAPSGSEVTVEIVADGADAIRIDVSDAGPAISAEDALRLIRPFDHANEGEAHRPRLALGLPLADRIVALHGGEMLFQARPGGGTRVRIRLPLDAPVRQGS